MCIAIDRSRTIISAMILGRKVSAQDVAWLRREVFAEGEVTREAADELFAVARAQMTNAPEWTELFVELITDHVSGRRGRRASSATSRPSGCCGKRTTADRSRRWRRWSTCLRRRTARRNGSSPRCGRGRPDGRALRTRCGRRRDRGRDPEKKAARRRPFSCKSDRSGDRDRSLAAAEARIAEAGEAEGHHRPGAQASGTTLYSRIEGDPFASIGRCGKRRPETLNDAVVSLTWDGAYTSQTRKSPYRSKPKRRRHGRWSPCRCPKRRQPELGVHGVSKALFRAH